MPRLTPLGWTAVLGTAALVTTPEVGAATAYGFDFSYTYDRTTVNRPEPRTITLPGPFGGVTLDAGFLPFSPFAFDRYEETDLESLTVNVTGTITCYAEEIDPDLGYVPVSYAPAEGVGQGAEQLAVEATVIDEDVTVESFVAEAVADAVDFAALAQLVCDPADAGGDGSGGDPAAVPSPTAAAAGLGLFLLIAARRQRTRPRRIVG